MGAVDGVAGGGARNSMSYTWPVKFTAPPGSVVELSAWVDREPIKLWPTDVTQLFVPYREEWEVEIRITRKVRVKEGQT